jgi:hypothetical protein
MRIGPKVHLITFIGSSLYDTRPIFFNCRFSPKSVLTQNKTLQFSKLKNQIKNRFKNELVIFTQQE